MAGASEDVTVRIKEKKKMKEKKKVKVKKKVLRWLSSVKLSYVKLLRYSFSNFPPNS